MGAQQPPITLQGQVSKTVSFQDVINQNPEGWAQEPPEVKSKIADAFFQKHVASQPGFADEDPETQATIRTEFNKKYQVGDIQFEGGKGFEDLPFFDPTPGKADQLSGYINAPMMALGGITGPAHDLLNPFYRNAYEDMNKEYQKAYPGIETDPGFLGDLYRFRTNRYTNMAGQLGGAFGAIRQIATRLPQNVLSRVPYVGKLSNDARNAIAATGIFSGLTNTADVVHGKQNPVEAIGNTAMDVVTAPLGGSSRIRNALVQGTSGGLSGGASSILGDLSRGQKVDWQRAQQMAGEQAAIGAGMGLGLGGHGKQKKQQAGPKVRNFDSAQSVGTLDRRTGRVMSESAQRAQQLKEAVQAKINEARTMESTSEAKTLQAKIRALQKQYENLSAIANNQQMDPKVRQTADRIRKQVLESHRKLNSDYQSKYGKPEKNSKTLKKGQLPTLIKAGVKAHKAGGEAKKRFREVVKGYNKQDQYRINKGIEAELGKEKTQAQAEKERATIRREQGKAKAAEINKTRQEKARQERQAENERIKAERQKQADEKKALAEQERKQKQEEAANKKRLREIEAEKKKAERNKDAARRKELDEQEKAEREREKQLAAERKKQEAMKKAPPVLDAAEAEAKANELIAHEQANEKGQLSAKLEQYRKASKTDYTKSGMSKERSEAINKSYQRVLDRHAQMQAEAKRKPSAAEMKQGKEANRKELAELNSEGGRYYPGDNKALQRPAKGLTLEEAQKTTEWDSLDESTRDKADLAMAAAEGDHKVIIEYDAERSGDTGQFKLKTVSPLSLDFVGDRLVMHAINENGHHATYYLSESKANSKTGMASYTHEITLLPEQPARKGLDANIYHGQREVPVQDILNRPVRKTAGYTSETQAMLAESYGQDVHEVRKSIERRIRKKQPVKPQEIHEIAPKLDDSSLEAVYEKMDQSQKKGNWEDKTGEDC